MNEIVVETRNLTKEFVRDEFHVLALTKTPTSRSIRASSLP